MNNFGYNPFYNNAYMGQAYRGMGAAQSAAGAMRGLGSAVRGGSPFMTPGTTKGLMGAAAVSARKGVLKGVGKKITFGGVLDGTQKTLGTINQFIPIYNQVKPMVDNSKTIFKVFKGLKSDKKTDSKKTNMNYSNNYKFTEQEKIIDVNAREKKESSPSEPSINANKPSRPFFPS